MLVATTRATEVDDIALSGCVTPGSVIVPTALVIAEEQQAGPDALHAAIIVGYEAMIGFATAIGGAAILYRGIWPTLAAAPIGAAATAARLRGLDRQTTRHALALAIGRSAWWTHKGLPRWLQLGHAAVDGVLAAEAASAGFTTGEGVLDGWAAAAGVTLDPTGLTGLRPWIEAVDTKDFPTARQGLSAIQAFADLHALQPVTGRDRIEIALPAAYRAMVGGTGMPNERIASMLSAAYQMALIVHAPDRLHDAARTPPLASPEIADFLARVTVHEDRALDLHYPAAWGARVTIVTPDGLRRGRSLLDPEGSAVRPFGWSALAAKAAALARANAVPAELFVALRKAVEADRPAGELLGLLAD